MLFYGYLEVSAGQVKFLDAGVGDASLEVDLWLLVILNDCNIVMDKCLFILTKQMVAPASMHISIPHLFNLELSKLFIFTLQDGSTEVVQCALYDVFGKVTAATPEQVFRVVYISK